VPPVELAIDVTSPVYPYVQIADQLREAIARGEITDLLPSHWDIANDAGVSYNTARRAIKILKDEGLIRAVPGRGTFVRRD
jgi:GntR family transcriptional regulator